jgi:DNA-binding transcriptional ArsR family regulator/DNA-binding PadR family transcriptional regulator
MEHRGIAEMGALVGDETRARTLVALMNGLALPAGELARISNVSPATISCHLAKLMQGGLVKVEAQGKHRYYRLAGPKVATLIESFGTLVELPRVSRPNPRAPGSLDYARTCYQHLAGYVAVELNKAAIEKGFWLKPASDDKRYQLTDRGVGWLSWIGIEVRQGRKRKNFARECLDWSERRHHLAGELGSRLLERFLDMKWVARSDGKRSVRITHRGQEEFARHFGIMLRV